jgi:nucleotide-binding universal stress UspA family protein
MLKNNFMKKILVATDFSKVSLNAADYAADMALVIDAEIKLLHVYQMPAVYMEVPVVFDEKETRNEAERELNVVKERLNYRTEGKLKVETEALMGDFFNTLKSVCERIEPYAVVMGSQGSSAAQHLIFGNNAVYAMKNLEWPLITVPPEVSFTSINKIGLACDFNKVVESTPVDEIKKLVYDFNAELHVLNTGARTEFDADVVFESGLLQEMIGSLKPNYHFITNHNVDEGIMDFAEKNHIDLLLVLPKRHGLLDSLLHKSHTRQLVMHSHVPVMALHQ